MINMPFEFHPCSAAQPAVKQKNKGARQLLHARQWAPNAITRHGTRILSEHSVADTTMRYLRKLPPVPIRGGYVAKLQVVEGKQTQFRYLAAIESIEAVGKDIYTFSNGRIINLPKEGSGSGKIGGRLRSRGCFKCACDASVTIRMMEICSPYPRRMRANHPRRGPGRAAS